MFKKLKIFNFQKYKTKKIKFSPNITTIWGPTESGKSAIIRSLVWLCLNDPPGTLIRNGCSKAWVKLYVDNYCIKREKSKCKNSYKINKQEYNSVGQNVPNEVQNILSMSTDNFQQQHDAHFWFSCSAGEVSRQLNKIVNLEIIDNTLYKIAEKLRHSKMVKKITEESLEKIKQSQKELSIYSTIDIELKKLEFLESAKKELENRFTNLSKLITEIKKIKNIQISFNEFVKNSKVILKDGELLQKKIEQKTELSSLLKNIKMYNNITKITYPSDIALQDIRIRAKEISKTLQILVPLKQNIEKVRKELKELKTYIDENNNIMIAEMKDRCPLCKQKIIQ